MNVLQIGILIFVFIESLNILLLYFMPTSKIGNGVGVFNALEDSKKNDTISPFVGYLINWVAGTKLIFVLVGIVIVIFGNENTQLYTIFAFIISILSFYWRLFPTIKKLDKLGQLTPKGYSKTLNFMILGFIVMFIIVLILYFI